MFKRFFIYSLIFLVFFSNACFFDHDDDVVIVNNPVDNGEPSFDFELESDWHENIICTRFSILKADDPLSSEDGSAFMETTEVNPYYFALPFNNRTYDYYKAKAIDQNKTINIGSIPEVLLTSEVKNRWIEINYNGKSAFAQWEDVGPWYFEDWDYVFDMSAEVRPRAESHIGQRIDRGLNYTLAGVRDGSISDYDCNGAGLDVSKYVMKYLTGSEETGKITVKWRFVKYQAAYDADPERKYWYNSTNYKKAPLKVNLKRVTGK